jgi:hypothetical protein
MDQQKVLSWLLRVAGACEVLAFAAVIMPQSWMESTHAWLGMGKMVTGPVTIYMIRQASYTYGLHGIFLWILASDVQRYRPLVIFTGISFLLAGLVFFLIDYTSGLPLWWSISDALAVATFGASVLWLTRSSIYHSGKQ